MKYTKSEREKICEDIRIDILKCINSCGKGHVGGSLSLVETLVVLYYEVMNIDSKDPKMAGRDRLVLSKGHGGPALYSVLSKKGFFDKSALLTLNKPNTMLPSHPDMKKIAGVDMTTGSLGQGVSAAVGMAYASKLEEDDAYIYTILGDGECQEGQVWEAALAANNMKLDNLIAFVDYNKMQLDGSLEDIVNVDDMAEKWRSFGFHSVSIDGHDMDAIYEAINEAKKIKDKPKMIVLNTVKGKGYEFIEKEGYKNHSMPVTEDMIEKAIAMKGGDTL